MALSKCFSYFVTITDSQEDRIVKIPSNGHFKSVSLRQVII